jgi:hypothetical protein
MDKPFKNLEHEVCRLLRWKEMFISGTSSPAPFPSNDQSYWCSETQRCIGPDGRVADPEGCSPTRSCYDQLSVIKFT